MKAARSQWHKHMLVDLVGTVNKQSWSVETKQTLCPCECYTTVMYQNSTSIDHWTQCTTRFQSATNMEAYPLILSHLDNDTVRTMVDTTRLKLVMSTLPVVGRQHSPLVLGNTWGVARSFHSPSWSRALSNCYGIQWQRQKQKQQY